MRRFFALCVAIALTGLALPALGKGAVSATIEGDGLSGPIHIDQRGEPGSGTALGNLLDHSGFFVVAFGEPSTAVAADPPKGELGPMLTVSYDLGGPIIAQQVYPLAEGGPVVFLQEGQKLWDGAGTGGGWYRADNRLITALEALDVRLDTLAASRPAPLAAPVVGGVVIAALIALAGVTLLRRRGLHPATG